MTNGDDLAFPQLHTEQGFDGNLIDANLKGGLTKREYYAGLIMTGMIGKKWGHVDGHDGNGNFTDAIECAQLSVAYADALIAELNKGSKSEQES